METKLSKMEEVRSRLLLQKSSRDVTTFEDEERPSDEEPTHDLEFTKIQKNYDRIVNELEQDPMLAKYLEQFIQMYDFLEFSYQEATKLSLAREDLETELAGKALRLKSELLTTELEENHIDSLKQEMDTSLQLIENAYAREEVAQDIIASLRKQIANLNMEIDFKNKIAQGELEENPAAVKVREKLEREKAKLISEVSKLSEKLSNALAYQEELEKRTVQTDDKILDIRVQLEETQTEVDKYNRIKEKLEGDMTECGEEMLKKNAELNALNEQMLLNQRLQTKFDAEIKEQTASASKCTRALYSWNNRVQKMQKGYEAMSREADHIKYDTTNMIKALRLKDEARSRVQFDITKVIKDRELADLRTRLIEESSVSLSEETRKLKDSLVGMKRDYDAAECDTLLNKNLIEDNIKECETYNRNLLRQQAVSRDHQKVLKVQEQVLKKLELQIDEHVIEERRILKDISGREKERDRMLGEGIDKAKRMYDINEETRLQESFITDLKKNLADCEARYKTKQSMFDTIRAERNALQKSLQEFSSDITELKEKLKICHRQSEQLKEEIGTKELMLTKMDAVRRKLLKEKEYIKIQLNSHIDQVRALKQDIVEQKAEEKRLRKVVHRSMLLINDHNKTITSLMGERDILGSQLVRRNDEIALVSEKIKIIQATLHYGEAEFEQRLNDIKLLKVEIKRLRHAGSLLTKSINTMNSFRVNVLHLERELAKERMKSNALQTELYNPMNIKRWRKLLGPCPDLGDLLAKTASLQKRLVTQACSTLMIERKLKDAEQDYLNLRVIVLKQPGQKVQHTYNSVQKILFANTVKNKCLISELNMMDVKNRQCAINLRMAKAKLRSVKGGIQAERNKSVTNKRRMNSIRRMSNIYVTRDSKTSSYRLSTSEELSSTLVLTVSQLSKK